MKITKKTKIREIIEKKPKTVSVFQKYEMGCMGCSAAFVETVEDAVQVHGIDLDSFLNDLNEI